MDRQVTTPADPWLERLGLAPSMDDPPSDWLVGPPWWDLREHNLRALLAAHKLGLNALHGVAFRRVCFGDRERDKQPAKLDYASFKGCEFTNCVFPNTPLLEVYFRECTFYACDFRYAQMLRSSFQDSIFYDTDFYRAFFEAANIFTKARFERVSFDKAWLAGALGLTASMFPKGAMAQECSEASYAEFLAATTGDRPPSHVVPEALEKARLDVAAVYRALSGLWTSQGQLRDAGFAYVRCKSLEREYYSPLRRWSARRGSGGRKVSIGRRDVGVWLGLVFAWAIANFGESMRRVAVWLAALIVLPGVAFSLLGGVLDDSSNKEVRSLCSCLLFSFEQMTASVHAMHSANRIVDLVGAGQVFLGVALLGLFGFTLANRLRNA
jgi:hypothetical protein